MKAKLSATKLENADVSHISLVPRGANRAPFKIIKSHKGEKMIQLDLTRVFKKDGAKKEEKAAGPEILGYVIQKSDNTEAVRKALADAGVKVEAVKEFEDGTVLFAQQEVTEESIKDAVALKDDTDFAVVVKGFDPYSVTEGTSFGEILKAQGFMPGFHMAAEALFQTVRNSLTKSADQKEAVGKISEALNEFSAYTTELAGSIPMSAFKAGEAFRLAKDEQEKAAKAQAEEAAKKAEADRVAKEAADKAAAEAAATAKKEEVKDEPKAEAKKEEVDAAKLVSDAIVKSSEATAKLIADALKPVSEAVVAVKASVETLSKDLDQVKKDAKDAKATADAADKVLKGAVIGGGNEDDNVRTNEKKEESSELGVFDTAFNRNIRKNDAARAAQRKNHLL